MKGILRFAYGKIGAFVLIAITLSALTLFSATFIAERNIYRQYIYMTSMIPSKTAPNSSVNTGKPKMQTLTTREPNTTKHPCIDPLAIRYRRVEDIYCINLPKFLPQYKNPCYYEFEVGLRMVLRCVPYFYVIGMDKCGTTDLHNRLASHPDVRNNDGSLNKETSYWSWYRYGIFNYKMGVKRKLSLGDYVNFYNSTSSEIQRVPNSSHIITGDATPMDLWDFRMWSQIPQNFGKKEPAVLTPHLVKYVHQDRIPKFFIQLREPVERLYSDYIFLMQGKNELTFHNHVVKAISIIEECLKGRSQKSCFFDRAIYQKLPTRIHLGCYSVFIKEWLNVFPRLAFHITRIEDFKDNMKRVRHIRTRIHLGCYSVFIKEWLNVFPRSAFHITRTEDFKNNMKDTLRGIFSFLDLKPLPDQKLDAIVAKKRRHVTTSKKGAILPQTFKLLKEFYRPFLEETTALLNDERFLWKDVYKKRREQEQNTPTAPTLKLPVNESKKDSPLLYNNKSHVTNNNNNNINNKNNNNNNNKDNKNGLNTVP